jgi:hypothetical protein
VCPLQRGIVLPHCPARESNPLPGRLLQFTNRHDCLPSYRSGLLCADGSECATVVQRGPLVCGRGHQLDVQQMRRRVFLPTRFNQQHWHWHHRPVFCRILLWTRQCHHLSCGSNLLGRRLSVAVCVSAGFCLPDGGHGCAFAMHRRPVQPTGECHCVCHLSGRRLLQYHGVSLCVRLCAGLLQLVHWAVRMCERSVRFVHWHTRRR